MVVLALDASLSSTGFAVVRNDMALLEFGKLATKKKTVKKKKNKDEINTKKKAKPRKTEEEKIAEQLDEDNRIFFIASNIMELFDKYNIDAVSMESQFLMKNVKTALQLSRLRGALMMVSRIKGVELEYPEPSVIRERLMDKGDATKEEVAAYIQELYSDNENVQQLGPFNDNNNKDKNSDIYDAISIGVAYFRKKD
jgi:crossover junction endodeoxyribonuclease RuvC